MKEHTIWNEKYRSSDLSQFIVKDELRDVLQKCIDTNDIPHLLFFGKPGSGKTTISKLLTKNIDCDYLFLNASDERGIDTIRDKVKGFASAASFKPLKIIVLDEADYLTVNAQMVLRNVIETFARTTRFILTGNYLERIVEPLQSRCQVYKLEPPSKKDVAIHVAAILKSENIKYDKNDIVSVIQHHYPDIRSIINTLQSFSSTGTLVVSNALSSNYKAEIFELLKSKNWEGIRQIIVDNDIRDFTDIYSFLYEKYFATPEVIVIIAEYQYKQAFVVDKEICFMACVAKILEVKKIIYG